MDILHQSPSDPAFVQNPYPVYHTARQRGPVLFWQDYNMAAVFDAATVQALLRDRRLGRTPLQPRPYGDHMADWVALEHHSMLELEPPRHTRLRGLVLRAFTSRRIAGLRPDIEQICAQLLRSLPKGDFDLIPAYCTELPVRIIARLLGVPEDIWQDLLHWSNTMVAMYQTGRTRAVEDAANTAAAEFTTFLRGHIKKRRQTPGDDLITHLIAAEEEGQKLSLEELISNCILLLNAGHEATVHSLGNAVKCLIEQKTPPAALGPTAIADTVEELLRYDPPLHMFTRFAYEDIQLAKTTLKRGEEVALMLGAAGRDPALYHDPDTFDPSRTAKPHAAFGGGLHFCVGAPLARLELHVALPALFTHLPNLTFAQAPKYANTYHFHKLNQLILTPQRVQT